MILKHITAQEKGPLSVGNLERLTILKCLHWLRVEVISKHVASHKMRVSIRLEVWSIHSLLINSINNKIAGLLAIIELAQRQARLKEDKNLPL